MKLPHGERVLLRTRPGFLFVLLYRQGWWLVPPLALFLARAAVLKMAGPDSRLAAGLLMTAGAWLVLGLAVRIVAWLCRSYVLTTGRLFVAKGVLSRAYAEVPLARIQHTATTQTVLERAFALGTISISTADGNAINWLMTPRPATVVEAIRHAAEHPPRPLEPVVIGLAGGIGSGKSEVARILGSLGCMVIDSDAEARQALDRPEVRERLVQWWGGSIVQPDGTVNRRAVADIVFKDPAERERLESLVHPLVRARRAEVRRRAIAAGAHAVVIDAPLLFEAGVDAECDTVIFVDAPREVRLARVRATRNWDEAELARRERNQLAVDEKRRRSRHVIPNSGDTAALANEVRQVLAAVLASHPHSADS